ADLDAAGTFHHRSVDGAAIAKGQCPVGDLDCEPAGGDGVVRVALIIEHVAETADCGVEDRAVAAVADQAAARIAHGDGGCGGGEFCTEGVEAVVGQDSPVALEFENGVSPNIESGAPSSRTPSPPSEAACARAPCPDAQRTAA